MGPRGAVYGDAKVGRLTSGGYSVAFGKSIGMGYVRPDLAVEGTKLKVKMFDQLWDATVTCDSPYDPTNAAIRKDSGTSQMSKPASSTAEQEPAE